MRLYIGDDLLPLWLWESYYKAPHSQPPLSSLMTGRSGNGASVTHYDFAYGT